MTSIDTPSSHRPWLLQLRAAVLQADEVVYRLRIAGEALERHAALHPTQVRPAGRSGLLRGGAAGLLLLVLATFLLRLSAIPRASACSLQAACEPDALSPLELRTRRDRSGSLVDNLSDNIRGYYSRIPGGFRAAVRSAEQASRAHPLDEFPRLAYHLVNRDSPVTFGPLPVNEASLTPSKAQGQYCPEQRRAFVLSSLAPQQTQEVIEHELTHAWQFMPADEENPDTGTAWRCRYRQSLGSGPDTEPFTVTHFNFEKEIVLPRFNFLRDYLCRPVEVDPRLAALKRWWAWNHGELLDTTHKAREAFEHPRMGSLTSWSDVSDAWRIWDSYRGQPEVQHKLLLRVIQLL